MHVCVLQVRYQATVADLWEPPKEKTAVTMDCVKDERRQLWSTPDAVCVMLSCCSGAELQVCRPDGEVLLRELYPTKSDLYERVRILEAEYSRLPPGSSLEPPA